MKAPSTAVSPPEGRVFDRRFLLLALVPVAVYLLLYLVLKWTRPAGIEFETLGLEILDATALTAAAAAEAHFRYLWVSAFLLSCAASLAVAISCALSLWTGTPARDRRLIFTLLTATAALFVLVETLPGVPGQERWYVFMGEGLYRSVFGGPDGPHAGEPLWMLDIGLDLIKACGAVALTLITAALILTLARDSRPESPERRAEHLARALARQRDYLMQGATVYVFALIAMLSWMYWPLPYLADEATRASYRQLVVGAAVLQGVGYSLGIAAVYLPPALLLRRRVACLAGEAPDDGAGVEDWLREKGLEAEPLDQLRQAAALLMPAMVSLLPALNELWR